jgi:hypothetical protein
MNDCNPIPCACIDGPQGPQGLNGPKGDDGAPGVQGDQGVIGDQGEQGGQGEQGIDGEQGDVGDTIIGGIGPIGEQGSLGNQGPIGDPGPDGINGTDGTDGTDTDAMTFQERGGYCAQGDVSPGSGTIWECYDCISCGSPFNFGNGSVNGKMIFNQKTGPGYSRVDFGNSWDLGARCLITSYRDSAGFKLRAISDQITSVEMTAFNSYSDNVIPGGVTSSSQLGNTWPENGFKWESPNGSDCIEVLHVGNDEFVVIKALLAAGLEPTVII